jgi:predicted enzyme related to lactoylglutathione lyase
MPERTSYDPGTPSWVDLGTSDPEAAKEFYGGLFGWEWEYAGDPELTGGYSFFTLRGRKVAGVGPLMGEGQVTAWSTYVATDDVEALTRRAESAGAAVLMPPMDVFESGRLAFYAHPAGGMIGAWEPKEHIGAELVNEHGALDWNELHTRDVEGAKAFGEAVFGWRLEAQDMGVMTYTIAYVGENGVAGMMDMPPGVPDEVTAYWMTIFAIDDADAAASRIPQLGGRLDFGPSEMEGVGRFAYGADPQGAVFGVIQLPET